MDHYFLALSAQSTCENSIAKQLKQRIPNLSRTKYAHIDRGGSSSWQNLKDVVDSQNERTEARHSPTSTKKIAGQVHSLADDLPMTGSYLLDVIWSWEFPWSCTEINLHLELFGSLKRLASWHNANIQLVVPESQKDNVSIRRWAQLLYAKVTALDEWLEIVHKPVVWHGRIAFTGKHQMILKNFCLSYSGKDEHVSGCFNLPQKESLYCSTQMDVLKACSLENLPLHLLSNDRFVLSLVNSNSKCKNILKQWLKSARSKKEAVVLRLLFTNEQLLPDVSEFVTTTESWEQSIQNGTWAYFPALTDSLQQLTFMMFEVPSTSQLILRRFYQPSEINGIVAHKACTSPRISNWPNANADPNAEEIVNELIAAVPYCSSEFLKRAVSLVPKMRQNVVDYLQDEGRALTKDLICEVDQEILSRVFRGLPSSNRRVRGDVPHDAALALNDHNVEPSCWPERIALRHHFSTTDSLATSRSRNPSGILSADDAPVNDCVSILSYFSSTGDAKKNLPLQNCTFRNPSLPLNPNVNDDDLKFIGWPHSKHSQYPDVYYNKDKKSEQLEWTCCELKTKHVVKETLSTFLVVNEEPRLALSSDLVPSNIEEPVFDKKERPSAATPRKNARARTASTSAPLSLRRSPRKKVGRAADAAKVDNRTPRKRVGRAVDTAKVDNRTPQNAVALRRSPRKKVSTSLAIVKEPVRTSPRKRTRTASPQKSLKQDRGPTRDSSRRGGNTNDEIPNRNDHQNSNTKQPRSRGPMDSYRRKLRVVVADTLAEQGISEKHPLYQICGKKLLVVCNAFGKDMLGQSGLTDKLKRVAHAHVKQVVSYEQERAKVFHPEHNACKAF